MEINQLTAILTTLTGHLQSSNDEDEKNIEMLQVSVAEALMQQDPSTILSPELVFEKSDLFMSSKVEGNRLKKISELANVVSKGGKLTEMNVFVRRVPVRSTQIPGSITSASAGARVRTIGPLPDGRGTSRWFDFVKVKKLISLYVQGQSKPVMLFDATFKKPRLTLPNAKPIELTKTFNVDPESVWIHARVFSADVPDDLYCGLRVKSGTITLNADPFMAGTRLTVSAATLISADLSLEQNDNFDDDPSSPYGIDARQASIHLPDNLKFTIKNNVRQFTAINPARWTLYGHTDNFIYENDQNCIYNGFIGRVGVPMRCDNLQFAAPDCKSPFMNLRGSAKISNSWWTLPVTKLDLANPLEADSNGALIIGCEKGLTIRWTNLQNKAVSLKNPFILAEPGRICFTDMQSDGSGAFQKFDGWKDDQNPYGTTFECKFRKAAIMICNSVASGHELLFGSCDWDIKTDRPVKVNGEAVSVKTKNSPFIIALGKAKALLAVIDQDILWDNKLPADEIPHVTPYALAMHNALFTVTPPNSLVVFAEATPDLKELSKGVMYLGFGLFSYLPTLPDPYAANLGVMKRQFDQNIRPSGVATHNLFKGSKVWLWLIGLVKWSPQPPDGHKVDVSFHFAPLSAPLNIEKEYTPEENAGGQPLNISAGPPTDMYRIFVPAAVPPESSGTAATAYSLSQSQNVNKLFSLTDFALIDVSSNANQMGIAYAKMNNGLQVHLARKYKVNIADETNASVFPIQVSGLDVITAGMNAQAFTVPSVAWEPVFNLTHPDIAGDPPVGFNYYPNDGIATRVGNLSKNTVSLAPIPMSEFLVETYKNKEDGKTYALFNLPFGMLALTILDNKSAQQKKPSLGESKPVFGSLEGGIQLELKAGTSFNPIDDSDMFEGFTIQLMNINDINGNPTNASTLAKTPTTIFNNEFFTNSSSLPARPGVPLTGINLSGYGASMFSEWQNKGALFAQTSQAQFKVITGRTSHEVVQVKSMLYPWGIRVVRTITLFRLANGYVARIDSGWKAESDGKYDFSYYKPIVDANGVVVDKEFVPNPFGFQPGIIRGLFNVRNIHEQPKSFKSGSAELQAVTFDADVELENVTEGGENNRVASKGVVAYVQVAPAGEPINATQFAALLKSENNSIGGPVSCTLKIAGTNQRMKINRFDVNNSTDPDNSENKEIFVCAARGSVMMPKDGSWTMVQHNRGTGEVTPLPEQLNLPLIRVGKWVADKVVQDADVLNVWRIAHPEDLLKPPDDNTVSFGFLQNMGTQKVLFMKPLFKKGVESLMSNTPPLLADSFRLLAGSSIFTNIGKMEGDDFGSAIALSTGVSGGTPMEAFKKITTDAGEVFNLLELLEDVEEGSGKLLDQGYKLLKNSVNDLAENALNFDLPSFGFKLVDLPEILVLELKYQTSSKTDGKDYVGKFDFDVNSFALDLADTWKGRMNNLAVVVSIGPMTEVMKIKGNFNSQKGKDVDLGSGGAGELPVPEIEFSDALQPVIDILELLASLSSGDYAGALKKGLKVAMSNSGELWEYKFSADKEIALIQFPPQPAYDAPLTPLKLEASLSIGISCNAALKVTTDPSQLLPTAGGYFKFHGGLQVMCASLGAASIYAVGNVDLKLEVDTSPKLAVTVAFGFGAQINVGIPVVGTASILFMVGVEIYVDTTGKLMVTAFMYFRGEAELLGGLVSVTITIEARGTVEKTNSDQPANCIAQVSFAIDITVFWVIDISFSESWEESRQIA
ncbi:MAG TPA: hypothetical protein PKW80_13025 [Bacteroidales bacterium]|nr:hypothetical protein [Bacteroidales bacterium]